MSDGTIKIQGDPERHVDIQLEVKMGPGKVGVRILRVLPDGRLRLRGVPNDTPAQENPATSPKTEKQLKEERAAAEAYEPPKEG